MIDCLCACVYAALGYCGSQDLNQPIVEAPTRYYLQNTIVQPSSVVGGVDASSGEAILRLNCDILSDFLHTPECITRQDDAQLDLRCKLYKVRLEFIDDTKIDVVATNLWRYYSGFVSRSNFHIYLLNPPGLDLGGFEDVYSFFRHTIDNEDSDNEDSDNGLFSQINEQTCNVVSEILETQEQYIRSIPHQARLERVREKYYGMHGFRTCQCQDIIAQVTKEKNGGTIPEGYFDQLSGECFRKYYGIDHCTVGRIPQ